MRCCASGTGKTMMVPPWSSSCLADCPCSCRAMPWSPSAVSPGSDDPVRSPTDAPCWLTVTLTAPTCGRFAQVDEETHAGLDATEVGAAVARRWSSRSSRRRRPRRPRPRTRSGRRAAGRPRGPGPAEIAIGWAEPAVSVVGVLPVGGRGTRLRRTAEQLRTEHGPDNGDDREDRDAEGELAAGPPAAGTASCWRSPSARHRPRPRRTRRLARPALARRANSAASTAPPAGWSVRSSRSAAISSRCRGMPPRTCRGRGQSPGVVAHGVGQGASDRPRRRASARSGRRRGPRRPRGRRRRGSAGPSACASASTTRPSSAMRMVPGCTLPWTMPAECSAATASAIAWVTSVARSASSGAWRSTSRSAMPGTHSRTR